MARIGAVDDDAVGRELRDHNVDQGAVEVAAAEEVVAVVPDDAQQPFLGLEQGHVEGSAAEIVDQPRPIAALARPAGGDR
jgi:hypothetical protein